MSQPHRICFASGLINTLLFALLLLPLAFFVFGGQDTSRSQASKTGAQHTALKPESPPEPQPAPTHFYRTAKPYTRWWWFASEIKKDDIVRQLDWLKGHDFGGVEVAWVYPLNIERYKRFYTWITDEQRKIVEPRQKWQSPEWSEIVAFAKEYADKIGLGMDFTFGTAWPFGDSQVPKEDGAKIYGHPEAKQEVIISWEYPQNGLVIDHMSKGAFARYAARMGAALSKATHTGGKSALFCDSWEVKTKGIWTDGFGEAFKKRYGYAIEPYMDSILAPENAGPRYDYMKLVSEYVIENFYKPFTEASHRFNAFSRVQAHGSPTDLITAYATADVPETEALLFEPNFARIAASAAALSGKRDVTSETFTCAYGFPRAYFKEEQAADLKLIADAVLANGVNHVIWHGTPFSPQNAAHDSEFYASVHVGEKGALAGDLTSFNEYMEKVSAYMDEGRTFSSLAVYIPVEDAWVQGEYPKELQFRWTGKGAYELRYIKPAAETRGYHPLWINGEFLRRAKIENGRLNVGDASFSSLYLDVDYLDGDSLGTILEIAKTGFPVCLKKKPKQPGRNQTASYKEQLKYLAKLPNVSADLKGLAIPKPLVEGQDLPDFWCREKGGEYNIFFAQPLAQDLKMPLKYGQSFMDKEITRRVTINIGGKSTPLDLVFKPYQSLLVTVDKNGNPRFVDITYVPRTPVVKEDSLPAASALAAPAPPAPAAAPVRTIETALCTLRLDTRTGDLVGLDWKSPRVEVIREARLGENFRILLPRPGYEANYFNSRDQQVARIEETADGVTCVYDSLRNSRETVDVKVRYHIRAVEGRLEFSVEVDNSTGLPLAEVFFGIVGGQQGLLNRLDTESLVPGWFSNAAPGLFTNFRAGGYGGGSLPWPRRSSGTGHFRRSMCRI